VTAGAYLLDSSAAIDLIRGRKPAIRVEFRAAILAGRTVAISAIALFELRAGVEKSLAREREEARLSSLLASPLEVWPFDAGDAAEAGVLRVLLERRGAMIGPWDLLIAAQARRRGAALITGNLREFARVPGLAVMAWS
jgi:tRNA(fMet)-specific endonuclease VapC